jgi:chromosome segregation ATPase
MSETRPGDGPEQRLEHEADALEEQLDRLEDHIEDAEHKAQERREEANPAEGVAGDWDETRGTPGQGEDPEGAIDR